MHKKLASGIHMTMNCTSFLKSGASGEDGSARYDEGYLPACVEKDKPHPYRQ